MNDRRIQNAEYLFLIVLVSVITGLAVWGAGVFPGSLHLAGLILIATACAELYVNRINTTQHTTYPHLESAIALALMLIVLSILPIPTHLEWICGQPRCSDFENTRSMLAAATSRHHLIEVSNVIDRFSFSYNRAGTIRAILLIGGMSAVFVMVTRLTLRARMALLMWFIVLGAAVAVAGYLGKSVWPQGYRLWWLFPAEPNPVPPIGGFMNRNHFGGVLTLCVPPALGLAAHAVNTRRWPMAVIACVMCSLALFGIAMCQSRGAFIAAGVGIMATLGLILMRPFSVGRLMLFIIIVAGTAAAVAWMLPPEFLVRFRALRDPWDDAALAMRLNAWRDTLKVFLAYPLFGVGANALGMVYPQFRTSSHGGVTRFCDNEYVQFLAEFGLTGLVVAGAILILMWRRCRHQDNKYCLSSDVRAGIFGAMAACSVHSLVDMPLRLPLYSYLFAVLAGLLCVPTNMRPARHIAIPMAAFAVILVVLAATAHRYRDVHRLDYPNALSTADASSLARTLAWAPTSSGGWFNLGRLSCNISPDFNDSRYHFGEMCMSTAALYDPQSARIWHQLGYVRMNINDFTGARNAFAQARRLRPWLSTPTLPDATKD